MKSTQTAALTLSIPQPQLWNENNEVLPQSTLKGAHAGNTAMDKAGAQLYCYRLNFKILIISISNFSIFIKIKYNSISTDSMVNR